MLQNTSEDADDVSNKEAESEKTSSDEEDVYDKIDWKEVAGEFEDGRGRQTSYEQKRMSTTIILLHQKNLYPNILSSSFK